MFPKHLVWHGMATMSPRYAGGSDQELEARVGLAESWEALPEEDREFLTACIRDVEYGVNGYPPMGPVEEIDAHVAKHNPDTTGPIWGVPWTPDTPREFVAPQMLGGLSVDDDAPEAKGYEFPDTDEGWIGL